MPPKQTASNRVTKSTPNTRKKASSTSLKPPSKSAKPATPTSTSAANEMPVNVISASTSTQEDSANRPVYFWRPHDGNGYLGQWYPSAWTHEGETYATAEMWMMVCKARLFGDEAVAKEMLATTDPKRHKALGREVSNFDAKTWDDSEFNHILAPLFPI